MGSFLTQTVVTGATWTLVYTAPATNSVTYHVFMLNRGASTASMSVAVGDSTVTTPTSINEMLVDYNLASKANQIGIQATLPPNYKVWVKAAAAATVNVTVYGLDLP